MGAIFSRGRTRAAGEAGACAKPANPQVLVSLRPDGRRSVFWRLASFVFGKRGEGDGRRKQGYRWSRAFSRSERRGAETEALVGRLNQELPQLSKT